MAELEQASREPLRLPSIDEVCAQVSNLDARLGQDSKGGKEQLRRWLKDGSIRIGPNAEGAIVAEGDLLPLIIISDGSVRKENYAEPKSMVPRRSTDVAGARFPHLTT